MDERPAGKIIDENPTRSLQQNVKKLISNETNSFSLVSVNIQEVPSPSRRCRIKNSTFPTVLHSSKKHSLACLNPSSYGT